MPKKGQKKEDFTPAQERQRRAMRRDFTKAQIKKVRELAEKGLTHDEIGAEFDMVGRTFRRRMKEFPEIRKQYVLGVAKWHGVARGKFHTIITRIGTENEQSGDRQTLHLFGKTNLGMVETQRIEVAESLDDRLLKMADEDGLDDDDDEDDEE